MTTIDDLRAFILDDATVAAAIGERAHQNHQPTADAFAPGELDGDGDALPYVVYFRRGRELELSTDAAAGEDPHVEFFDVEIYGDDLGEVEAIADAIKALGPYRGAFGAGAVNGFFVEDHSDDYIPRGNLADAGLHLAALNVEVYPR